MSATKASVVGEQPYIRLATLADLDELVETATRAFLDNTLYHYCADARAVSIF
jgi:hypothetical protein